MLLKGRKPESIGGVSVGDAGAGIYSGFNLAGGEDFNSLSLVKQHDPSGAYFPSHRRQGRRAINAAANDYYWSGDHTGHEDANRGIPLTASSDLVQQSGGALFLKTRLATAAEKAADWATTATTGPDRPQASGALHSAGYQGVKFPCIIEARVRIPTTSEGSGGIWPAFWMECMIPNWPNNGEWDFEWDELSQLKVNFITGDSSFPTSDPVSGSVVATNNDGAYHVCTLKATPTTLTFYQDDALIGTATRRPVDIVPGPMFWWLRVGVDLTPSIYSLFYDPATWTGKTPQMQCDWVRIWTQPSAWDMGYRGVIRTVNLAFGDSMSETLPSMSELWGRSDVSEWLVVQPFESAAPGMTESSTTSTLGRWYGQDTVSGNYAGPTICAWNKTTRSFTGSGWDQAGRMFAHLIAWDDTYGGLAGVARIVVNVGPRLKTLSLSLTSGVAMSSDIYPFCDCGMLVTDGTRKTKTISVTGLPAGLSYSDSTGLITGTPAASGSGNIAVTITNSIGQVGTGNIAYTVA